MHSVHLSLGSIQKVHFVFAVPQVAIKRIGATAEGHSLTLQDTRRLDISIYGFGVSHTLMSS